MWQKKFEKYGSENFTIVGLALDVEGVGPAKHYYEKHGVTFPSLVDPDYATGFGAVPKTFFVNEFGVVQSARNWERQLADLPAPKNVPDAIRTKWTAPTKRLNGHSIARLVKANGNDPDDLAITAQLGARYNALGLHEEARSVLQRAVQGVDAKAVAKAGGSDAIRLAQVYLQLSRSYGNDSERQVEFATLSYYLNPTIGFGKQIARLISPERFDERKDGTLDNPFREGTLRRLIRERKQWLSE